MPDLAALHHSGNVENSGNSWCVMPEVAAFHTSGNSGNVGDGGGYSGSPWGYAVYGGHP